MKKIVYSLLVVLITGLMLTGLNSVTAEASTSLDENGFVQGYCYNQLSATEREYFHTISYNMRNYLENGFLTDEYAWAIPEKNFIFANYDLDVDTSIGLVQMVLNITGTAEDIYTDIYEDDSPAKAFAAFFSDNIDYLRPFLTEHDPLCCSQDNLCICEDFFSNLESRLYCWNLFNTCLDNILDALGADSLDKDDPEQVIDFIRRTEELLVERTKYDWDYNDLDHTKGEWADNDIDEQYAYGPIVGHETVCAGYARAFTLILNRAGIEAVTLTANRHASNIARVGDEWFSFDVTADDEGRNKKKYHDGDRTANRLYSDFGYFARNYSFEYYINEDKSNMAFDNIPAGFDVPELAEEENTWLSTSYTLDLKSIETFSPEAVDAALAEKCDPRTHATMVYQSYGIFTPEYWKTIACIFESYCVFGAENCQGILSERYCYVSTEDSLTFYDIPKDTYASYTDFKYCERETSGTAGETGDSVSGSTSGDTEHESSSETVSSGAVIWANGNKDAKSVTLSTSIKATSWTDSKGKTKTGKVTTVKIELASVQSGKKASLSVQMYNRQNSRKRCYGRFKQEE